jgi:predicted MPP superfamily phosphohydrolase
MLKKHVNTLWVIGFVLLTGFLVFRYYPSLKIPFLFTTVLLLLHYYVWTAVKPRLKALKFHQRALTIFAFSLPVILLFIGIFALIIQPIDNWTPFFRIYFIGLIFTFIVSLLLPVIFVFLADVLRFFQIVKRQLSPKKKQKSIEAISRKKFLVNTGLGLGGLVLGSMSFGMLHGNYHFKKYRALIKIKNLPKSLQGLRIVQISDFHLGTWASKEPLIRAVEQINALDADLVFFTGDLVNNKTDEAFPFFEELKQLKAKKGIYCILGNHDYGNYHQWDSKAEKEENFEQLLDFYTRLNWRLLRNEHALLHFGEADLLLAGVENWSSNNHFPRLGDLDKALDEAPASDVTIVLSHDPSHWDAKILKHARKIDLSLSGHTHGFQVGIETPYFRWSPAQYIYKHWAGLYRDREEYLYVNRGIGAIGFPGRIGIRPEITLLELV